MKEFTTGSMKTESLLGNTYGEFTVIDRDTDVAIGKSDKRRPRWVCRCSCGNTQTVLAASLKSGGSKRCWTCRSKNIAERVSLSNGEAAFNALVRDYRIGAKKRGYNFELTDDEVHELTKGKCHYCGSEPSTIKRATGGNYTYNGIDRVDNKDGYTSKNTVSCCNICNVMKMALGYDEFITQIAKIYSNIKEKK